MTLAIAALVQPATAADTPAGAEPAQALTEPFWHGAAATEKQAPPWLSADSRPIARLRSFKHEADLIVLAGLTGNTMALGPGHLSASPLPGEQGNSVIGAHGDRHFGFLRQLAIGDRLLIERSDGSEAWFRVADIAVTDSRQGSLPLDLDGSWLTLVSDYPFDAIESGGSLRYVVSAQKLPRCQSVSGHAP